MLVMYPYLLIQLTKSVSTDRYGAISTRARRAHYGHWYQDAPSKTLKVVIIVATS